MLFVYNNIVKQSYRAKAKDIPVIYKEHESIYFSFLSRPGCTVVQTVCFVCLPYSPVLVFNVYMVCAGCLVVYQALHGGLRGSQGYARGIWG